MSERDEIAKCITPDGENYLPAGAVSRSVVCQRCFAFIEWRGVADRLIAANVRHLPSLVDDPEAVERVAQALLDRQVMGRRVVLANITTGEANEIRAQALAAIRALA